MSDSGPKTVIESPDIMHATHDFKLLTRKLLPNAIANIDSTYSGIIDKFLSNEESNAESSYESFFNFLKENEPILLVKLFRGLRTDNFFGDKNLDNSSYFKVNYQNAGNFERNLFLLFMLGVINPLAEKLNLGEYMKSNSDTSVNSKAKSFLVPQFSKNISGFFSFSGNDDGKNRDLTNLIINLSQTSFENLFKFLDSKQEVVLKMESEILKRHNKG